MDTARNTRIGRRIADLRTERGWSQTWLAEQSGMTQSVLSRVEAGRREARASELDRLARALGVEPGFLLEARETPGEAAWEQAVPSAQAARLRQEGAAAPHPGGEGAVAGHRVWRRDTPRGEDLLAGVRDEDAHHLALHGADQALALRRLAPGEPPQAAESLPLASWSDQERHAFEDDVLEEPRARRRGREHPRQRPSRPGEERARSFTPSPEVPSPSLAALPDVVAGVIADYGRLRALAESTMASPGATSAAWDSVDAHGRRRPAGKPSGSMTGRIAASVSWNEPRDRYARLWRYELGIGVDGPAPDLVVLFEDTGVAEVIVARLDTHEPVCANLTAPGTFGDPSDEVSFLFVNADRPVTLQRHALVHSFAHLALGHGDVVDRRIEWSRATPLEMEANDFAEEFLAPAEAVARWYDRHGDPRPTVDVLLDLAAAFGVTFWAAYYRSRAAGRLGEKPQAQLMRELRARQWQLLPEQSYRGGLRDTLSTLGEESPLPPSGAVGVGGVPAPLTREPATPAVLRVPGRLRVWTLQALRGGRLSLEQAAAVLRRTPADLAAELQRLGID